MSNVSDERVPLTSAVKVGGERLYKKARRGEAFETPVRPVHVMRLDVCGFDVHEQRAEVVVECSSGTYVRQLVADLGDAYCDELERTRIGPFRVEDADPDLLVPLQDALEFIPFVALDPESAERARHGVAVAGEVVSGETVGGTGADGPVRLLANGSLIAIAEPTAEGLLKPNVVLAP